MTPMTSTPTPTGFTRSDWRTGLPFLTGGRTTLRDLRTSDAPSLLAMLATDEVSRFISPPPTTVEKFERFIDWSLQERTSGRSACFAIVPAGMTDAVGIFQVRRLAPGVSNAEWGFAMGSSFWGTGLFVEGAERVIDFAFDVIGVRRLEARAAVSNGRGNGALQKIGAVQEGVLRRSFQRHGQSHDQTLWAILADDWRLRRRDQRPRVH
jgi:ribosomal-protein-alanine N-acetyltransferase